MKKNLLPLLALLLGACYPLQDGRAPAETPTPGDVTATAPIEGTETPTEPERTPRPEPTATPADPTQPAATETPDQGCSGTEDCDDDGDGYTEDAGDCDDEDREVHPGATDRCENGEDEDCDGEDMICPIDNDGDGVAPCEPGDDPSECDCNDANANVHPGAPELCNGLDDNCDNRIDNIPDGTCEEPDRDDDHDGHTVGHGDCDDTNDNIHPEAEEICGDGVDNDCLYGDLSCFDHDGDGDTYTENGGDCDDGDPTINPGAREVAINGVDENCSGEDAGLRVEGFHGQIGTDPNGVGVTMPSGYLLVAYYGGDSLYGSRSVQYNPADLPTASDPQDRVMVNLLWEDVAGAHGGHSWLDVFVLYDSADADVDKEQASMDGCLGWSFWQTAEEGAALNGRATMWTDSREGDCRVYLSDAQPTGSDVGRFTYVRDL